jgi:iron complex outermembrane receptor protein
VPNSWVAHRIRLRLRAVVAILIMMPIVPAALAQSPAEPLSLPTVEVISTSLLPGLGTPIQDVPANVQVHSSQDIARQSPSSLADYLEQNATSVNLNSAQGNPFQPDISFRGFSASPLLGQPQGLSVFQDGVRVNEPFGDVVNWDLIPHSAISSLQLLPGSHPGFGLNTLGGALSLQTKSGLTHPGGGITIHGGAFGRRAVEFEQGGSQGNWSYFLTGNLLKEAGWGDHNSSQLQQFFGKVGYATGQSTVDVSLTMADNTLDGSQTLPQSFSSNIRQAYTFPDQNRNRLNFLNIKGSHLLNDKMFLDGNLYVRQYRNQNISSNVNGNYDGVTDLVQATNDRSAIDQNSYGLGLQLSYLGELAGKKHQMVVGASADLGSARFTQEAQDAVFSDNRNTLGTSSFTLNTNANTDNRYYGVFLNDTLTLDERWALSLAGRYNLANIKIDDLSGTAPGLNGDHSFSRFNPAVGINFNPSSTFTAYGVYNEGMRAPTPIELTCANPAAPCKLPNNFLSDPPLQMVVAKTVELGMRGKHGRALSWSAALYRTELNDDIQFISSLGAGSNTGYFQNVGNSLRQGLELAVSNKWGPFAISLRYGYIDASYQSSFTSSSPANSSANAQGNIQVRPGDKIPGIPRHTLKLRLDQAINTQWSFGMSVLGSSPIYARGDENNQDANGQVPGFSVVNLDTRFRFSKRLELFARINNLLDRAYANFGTLGRNVFTASNHGFDGLNPRNEQFLGYGAPRGAWLGLLMRY